jgi:hypothetical protein
MGVHWDATKRRIAQHRMVLCSQDATQPMSWHPSTVLVASSGLEGINRPGR